MRTLAVSILLLSAAHADNGVEVGAALGGHAFSENGELGVADDASEPGPESAGFIAARLSVPLDKRLALEAELNVIPTKDDVIGDKATVYGLGAHARFDFATGRFRPFLVAGVGGHVLRSKSPQMDNDADKALHWGLGVRYAIAGAIDLRVDWRHLIVPGRTTNGAASDYELTAGLQYRFGVKKPAPPKVEAPVVYQPGDRDRDGLNDQVDRCAEYAEDKDNFQDTDGCPEPDNDLDLLADAKDKCPNEPEVMNGWQDEDGCPDEVIEELTGIGFELSSARIDVYSAPLLERAYQILTEHEQLSIEISGHTSAEGDPDRNLELSLRRAEAVRDYLVKRGIDRKRILTVGHGAQEPVAENKTEAGRRKNRRIEFRILTLVE